MVKVISFGKNKQTAEVVIITTIDGKKTSRTKHCTLAGDGSWGYLEGEKRVKITL